MTSDGLAGKVAMATGAARGIGLAMSEVLAANGVRVAMLDNRQQELEQAARGVPDTATFLADATDRTGVESVVAEIERRLGPLHALVANAGVISWKTFAEGSEADWDRAMAVNAKGVYLCCRAVYDGMKAHVPCATSIAQADDINRPPCVRLNGEDVSRSRPARWEARMIHMMDARRRPL